jgi:hypothetical protein
MVKYLFLIAMVIAGRQALAQVGQDSLKADAETVTDTVRKLPSKKVVTYKTPAIKTDSLFLVDSTLSNKKRDTIFVAENNFWSADSFLYINHPYFSFANPTRHAISVRQWQGKEAIFYSLIGLLIFFALIKNGFYRYFQDLTKIFFRTTLRQRQLRDQLVQTPLPSLLLNIFFLLSTGIFLALLVQYSGWGRQFHFWMLFIYAVIGLIMVYGTKFLVLKFLGWALQVKEATNAYIFIVFTTNKIIGIALLPFLIVLAFTNGMISQVAITLAVSMVIGLFAYRFFLSYVSIHRQVKISFFHFLIYLCAFEIIPLLLINKLLFTFLS